MMAAFCRPLAAVGMPARFPAAFGRTQANEDSIGPNSINIAPALAESGPISFGNFKVLLDAGQFRGDFGRTWPELGQVWPGFDLRSRPSRDVSEASLAAELLCFHRGGPTPILPFLEGREAPSLENQWSHVAERGTGGGEILEH